MTGQTPPTGVARMELETDSRSFDVVIVGSGVTGAMAALKLARAGKSVLVLEAGTSDALDPAKYQDFVDTYYTIGSVRTSPNGPYPSNPSALSPNDANQDPYFVQQGQQKFLSDYLRMVGGSTLHWQGTSVRLVPNDFRMQSTYGRAVDWPISYSDLEPFYEEAEWAIGVSANVADQKNFGVWFSEGYDYPMERMPQSYVDQFFIETMVGAKVSLFGGEYPLGVVSMPMARNSTPRPGYLPAVAAGGGSFDGSRCEGNSSCSPICPVQAKYNALKTLEAAKQVGRNRLEVRPQCVASRLTIDPGSGRITAVEYKHYQGQRAPAGGTSSCVTETARGKVFLLAANAIENAVLGLASGIVDRSGQLGRNLMDHPYLALHGLAPRAVYPFRGPDICSGIETLRDGRFREKHAAFRASIGNWGWVGEPSGTIKALLDQGLYGAEFRQRLHDRMTRMVRLGLFIEQLPDPNNRVTIDASHTDSLGNHLPILDYRYDEYSLDGALAALGAFWPAVLEKTGVQDETDFSSVPRGFQSVTYRGCTFNLMGAGHIVGTHRMGRNSHASVVDPNLRSWEHDNLYLLGPGAMPTIATANPTLTAAALSLRAADHILKSL